MIRVLHDDPAFAELFMAHLLISAGHSGNLAGLAGDSVANVLSYGAALCGGARRRRTKTTSPLSVIGKAAPTAAPAATARAVAKIGCSCNACDEIDPPRAL